MIKDNGQKEDMYEGLGDDKRGILLEDNKSILKSIWKKDVDGYFGGVRRSNSLVTESREIKRKKELKKSVF